jgi:hypothetical protein
MISHIRLHICKTGNLKMHQKVHDKEIPSVMYQIFLSNWKTRKRKQEWKSDLATASAVTAARAAANAAPTAPPAAPSST